MVLVEAMGKGLAGRRLRLPARAGRHRHPGHDGLLVPAQDVAGLTAALEQLMTDPARRRAYGEAALGTARAYLPAEIGARWEALLGGAQPCFRASASASSPFVIGERPLTPALRARS